MSLLIASLRAPAAPAASLQNESLASSSGYCVSPKVAQRATLFRRHSHEPASKQLAQPTCYYFDRISRIKASRMQAEHSLRSVPVQVAHEMMNAGHRCLDVRTQEEYLAGHVEGAINIPYLVKCGPGMKKNHRFLEEVEAEFGKDAEIIVGCQSGRRSMMAAAELQAANFNGVTDMGGGYVAWKESGLPVEVSGRRTQSHSV
ncbi:thiosulfate sulfurtransferase 16, chloroplastic isoform X3 [Physcomitrium patens]|uniref:Rhodanese domain-containing protein n=1 Tax=Physcomitrium patens TaxID=3218 RepID=A0A7I4FL23_PHYPA|nr:thiosulfate sulfurtransferase 16, chloroplastic-like isoform X3 [Physcomitrium patens]|eukprot:XP_024360386.1 thiosulfate sulfurtransferase 16, chloroplastic-like isoform X3 [Physcomitrella patens]